MSLRFLRTTRDLGGPESHVKAVRPPLCSQNTYIAYRGVVKNHLKPSLGHIVLQQLKLLDVERYYGQCLSRLSPRSVVLHHAMLRRALNAAVKSQRLRQNIATLAENRPKHQAVSVLHANVWSAEEARRFLATVKQSNDAQYAALFSLALDSGLRKSELLGVPWRDIEGTTLRVERQLLGVTRDDSGATRVVISLPKRKRARQLDLSEETLALLREHKRQQSELKLKNRLQYVEHGLVFARTWEQQRTKTMLGAPLCKEALTADFERLCREAGVKRISRQPPTSPSKDRSNRRDQIKQTRRNVPRLARVARPTKPH